MTANAPTLEGKSRSVSLGPEENMSSKTPTTAASPSPNPNTPAETPPSLTPSELELKIRKSTTSKTPHGIPLYPILDGINRGLFHDSTYKLYCLKVEGELSRFSMLDVETIHEAPHSDAAQVRERMRKVRAGIKYKTDPNAAPKPPKCGPGKGKDPKVVISSKWTRTQKVALAALKVQGIEGKMFYQEMNKFSPGGNFNRTHDAVAATWRRLCDKRGCARNEPRMVLQGMLDTKWPEVREVLSRLEPIAGFPSYREDVAPPVSVEVVRTRAASVERMETETENPGGKEAEDIEKGDSDVDMGNDRPLKRKRCVKESL